MSTKQTKEAVWKRTPATYAPNDIHSEHVWSCTHEYLGGAAAGAGGITVLRKLKGLKLS